MRLARYEEEIRQILLGPDDEDEEIFLNMLVHGWHPSTSS